MENACFCLPKNIVTPQFAGYSAESKLLFAMVFSNAEHTKAIYEVANMISKIKEDELNAMRRELSRIKGGE